MGSDKFNLLDFSALRYKHKCDHYIENIDGSKISQDSIQVWFELSFYPLLFFANTPHLLCLKNMIDKEFYYDGLKNGHKN